MASKRFSLYVLIRVLLIIAVCLLLVNLWRQFELVFTPALLLLLLLVQMLELTYFVNRTNRELKKFLNALEYGDYAVSFTGGKLGRTFKDLDRSFKAVIDTVRQSKAQQESQAELLELALENLSLGLIIVEPDKKVRMVNAAARQMLQIPAFRHWHMFQKKKPEFARQLSNFDFTGRKLIEIDSPGGKREFYLDLARIDLLGRTYCLITFSDLKNEIEQKEIAAWHKLIRILSHEVMNSVTPVTSLSETIKNLLTDSNGEALKGSEIDQERIDDILLALDTIIKRSRGMLGFVDEYRKLTKLPAPHYENISVNELLEEVSRLMSVQAKTLNVELVTKLPHNKLFLRADRKMVEQVLINLLSNAIYASEKEEDPRVSLSCNVAEDMINIEVADNGHGISEEVLPSIFIPFFSTRKNGSGIGLTLSKNIMQIHNGSISVESKQGEGSRFTLSFNL